MKISHILLPMLQTKQERERESDLKFTSGQFVLKMFFKKEHTKLLVKQS